MSDDVTKILQKNLPALGALALKTYEKALRGKKVSTAAYKSACDVLRTLGVIGEGAVKPVPIEMEINFIEVGSDAEGNPIQLTPKNETVCNTGPEIGGDVPSEVHLPVCGTALGQVDDSAQPNSGANE